MRIKNKFAVSFAKMVKETEALGGICKEITIDPTEAWEILNEIRTMPKDGSPFRVSNTAKTTELTQLQAKSLVYNGAQPISKDDAKEIITSMMAGHLQITFNDIPLRVVQKPKVPSLRDVPKNVPKKSKKSLCSWLRGLWEY